MYRTWPTAVQDRLLRLLLWFHIRDRTAKHLASHLAMCLALLLARRYSNVEKYLISIISPCRDPSEANDLPPLRKPRLLLLGHRERQRQGRA